MVRVSFPEKVKLRLEDGGSFLCEYPRKYSFKWRMASARPLGGSGLESSRNNKEASMARPQEMTGTVRSEPRVVQIMLVRTLAFILNKMGFLPEEKGCDLIYV